MTLRTGDRLGPYEIVALIGAGGMGEVYRARDTRLGRDVAVKVLSSRLSASPEVRARFEREARAISQLNHPHICILHDIGHQDGVDYLVMEYLEGETLASRLAQGPLPVAEVLRYGIEIACALDCAHRAGIAHRDLKPGNIMLTKSGAKLMDFGLARTTGLTPIAGTPTESPTVSRPLTAEGTIVGTFQYMAPERLEGKEADTRSDLWALGCVLYEMATGKRAFEGTSQASLIAKILKETPRPMAELQPLAPTALERIVKRCLEKDPDERFQSARDLAFDLEGLSGIGTAGAGSVRGAERPSRRLGAVVMAGAVIGAFLLAAGFFGGRLMEPRLQPPKFTRLTFQRGSLGRARFAPGATTVLYSAAWDGGPPDLFEIGADLSTTRPLGLSPASLQSVSANGELAVGRRGIEWPWAYYGTLAVVHSPGSAPRDLLEDVSCADWSPDGNILAVARRIGGVDRLEMPPGNTLIKTSGYFSDVRVSPDGRRIAFTEHSIVGDDRGRVALVDIAGRKATLTGEFANVMGVAWSPNGREIWFSAAATGMQQSLYAATPEGRSRCVARFPSRVVLEDIARDGRILLASQRTQTGIRARSSSDDKEKELGWLDLPAPRALSPDGRMLLFDDEGETSGHSSAVYLRNTDGSPPVRLGEGRGCALSPDGKLALAIQYRSQQQLVIMPTGSGETVALPHGRLETFQTADFLRDGRRILLVGAEPARPQRTWVQELPAGQPLAVTPEGAVGVKSSPDGLWVAAVTQDSTLALFPLRGGEARPITKLAPGESVSQWSADGRTLFVYRRGTRLVVFGVAVASGERRLWATYEVPDPAGTVMTAFTVTPDARGYAYSYLRILDELYLVEGLR